jgi:uncharacterized membrane protein SirB2
MNALIPTLNPIMRLCLGIWLMVDGAGSIIFVNDKKWYWQIGRIVRIYIGMGIMTWPI